MVSKRFTLVSAGEDRGAREPLEVLGSLRCRNTIESKDEIHSDSLRDAFRKINGIKWEFFPN